MKTFSVSKAALVILTATAVSGCTVLRTGQDSRYERVEVTPEECQARGGVTVVQKNTGEQVCRVTQYQNAPAGAVATAAASSGGASAAAIAGGLALVTVFALSNSSSGTQ